MKSTPVRDPGNALPIVAQWIDEGESVEVIRAGRPFVVDHDRGKR